MSIRVMLVDDEPLALENVYEAVSWQEHGFEVVARATNGKIALGLFERLRPHIVITDISMSPMDGLELGKRIRELGPNTRLIFLTAYRDFDYARQALDLKAAHYLLKHEISRNRLLAQLLKLREDIEAEQAEERHQRRRAWRALFDSKPDAKGEPETRENAMQPSFAVSLLYFELNSRMRLDGRRECDRLEDTVLLDTLAEETIRETEEAREILLLETEGGGYAAVVELSVSNSLLITQYALRQVSLALQRSLQRHTGHTPRVMIATNLERDAHRHWQMIRHQYAYAYFLPARSVFLFEQALASNAKPPSGSEERIQAGIKDGPESLTVWKRLLDDIVERAATDALLAAVAAAGEKWIRTGAGRPDMLLGSDAREIAAALNRSAEAIANAERQRSSFSRWVQKAMDHVRDNYADPELSLETVAEHLQISAVHLRTTFKKETGISLLDFTTEYRMEIAKQLLLKEDLKIYEVSEQVGYRTSQYFSQVFKKATGLHPKDYMRAEAER
ncbi:response regulator [Cohnella sp. GbtcB17]|uniref:response regulator n=1 Tax=Cohnella sp. GbtcB17 TaxID=2824762 RepID=UPI001C2F43A7|nr:response regulator [Cohnella sp. GbtcB17]